MKTTEVTIPWNEGLHLKPATRLVRLAQRFQSRIHLHVGDRIADGRSILSILLLAAACSMPLTIEAEGTDEAEAIARMESFFAAEGDFKKSQGESPSS